MKKLVSFTVAAGLLASIAASASAAEVAPITGTPVAGTPASVTDATYTKYETTITPADLRPATPLIILTKSAAFHFAAGSTTTPAGWLSSQTVDTTGQIQRDSFGNEWREIYTWLGKAWIKVPTSAYIITP